MKQSILIFIAGILITSLFAFTVKENILLFRPYEPRHTVAYNGEHPEKFTKDWAEKGYIVTSSASCGYYNTYVVMVKY